MKQYVLETGPRAVEAPMPMADGARAPGLWSWLGGPGWRTVGLILLVEPIALGVLYLVLVGSLGSSRITTDPGAASPPRRIEAPAPITRERAPRAPAPSTPPPPVVPQGRVTSERGGYAIDLRAVAPQTAVALLARSTGARVSGDQIFSGSALRLTHVSLAPSAREAWQAVFGDVASFALACPRGVCEVRFVSLVQGASPAGAAPSARLVEERVQGLSTPAPMAAPVEPPKVQPTPAPAPPAAPTDDPNASEN